MITKNYLNHHHALIDLIMQTTHNPTAIVEVGVWIGDLSESLSETFKGADVYLVDPWDGESGNYMNNKEAGPISTHEEDYENAFSYVLARFKDVLNVKIIRAPSPIAAKEFNSGTLDAVFIDADHSYKAVRNDILTWAPKIRVNGLLAGHDYESNSGVSKAVKEVIGKNILVTGKPYGNVWAIQVTEALNERLKSMPLG